MEKENSSDSLTLFTLAENKVRGILVNIDTVFESFREQHPTYPPSVHQILSQLTVLVVALSQEVGNIPSVMGQIQTQGSLHKVVVEVKDGYKVRGYADFTEPLSSDLPTGTLSFSLRLKDNPTPIQSIIPLSKNLEEDFASFFKETLGRPIDFLMASNKETTRGIFIRPLIEDKDTFETAEILLHSLTEKELLTLSSVDILNRLFLTFGLFLKGEKPILACCSCSQEKIDEALSQTDLSSPDSSAPLEAVCQFCGKKYKISSKGKKK